jgi:inner membrane protein
MDTLTHALSGALAARATEPRTANSRRLPRRTRLWLGFWAAAFPDSDVIANFIDPLTYLATHRGITHSIVMMPVWAAVLGFAAWWLTKRRYDYREIALVIGLGVFAHIVGDVITAFGTMVLAPLSDWRAAWPTTFIIDPYFTGIIIAGLVAAAIWDAPRKPALIALAVLGGYVALQGVLLARAVAIGEQYAHAQHLSGARAHALPQPFSPFNWMVVVEDAHSYHLAYVDLLAREPRPPAPADSHWLRRVAAAYQPVETARWQRVARFGDSPMEAELALQVWHAEGFARFRNFALFPALYRVDDAGGRLCVWFNDLRFALAGRTMPFRYGLCRQDAGTLWDVYRLATDGGGHEQPELIIRAQ